MEVVAPNDPNFLIAHQLKINFAVVVDGLNEATSSSLFQQTDLVGDSDYKFDFTNVVSSRVAPVINLSDVFFGHTYKNRSFVIVNQSNVSLDFTVTVGFNELCNSLLRFSLSNSVLKLFDQLTIEPQRSVRVYLHFQPRLPLSLTDDAVLIQRGRIRAFFSVVEFFVYFSNTGVSCISLSHYFEDVEFLAHCRTPQVQNLVALFGWFLSVSDSCMFRSASSCFSLHRLEARVFQKQLVSLLKICTSVQ